MSVTVVVGAQWGDEGKGKIVDILSAKADVVARYQGGANAGHTINIQSEQYILHLVPSGILHPQVRCVIGNGVVVDPVALLEEIRFLEQKGIRVEGRLFLSDRAHLIFPYHKLLDQLQETRRSQPSIGTTLRGIGPAYADKANRRGIRVVDLLDEKRFRQKLEESLKDTNQVIRRIHGHHGLNMLETVKRLLTLRKALLHYIADTSLILNQAIEKKEDILLEGAQGTLLDVDHGTYPFVTSSNPVSGGACTGCGIGPTKIDQVLGVMKAYTTRVGEGPFPTELLDKDGEYFRATGQEFGATTGRPRRCGWFDGVIARYAARVNGLTSLAITKLDVLDRLEEIKICIGYEYQGYALSDFPADPVVLKDCTPVYEKLPGWKSVTTDVTSFEALPENARKYIGYIENLTGVPVRIVSVGAKRRSTIIRS